MIDKKKYFLIFFFFSCLYSYSQKKDTIYIKFDDQYHEMQKSDFTHLVQAGSPNEKLDKSIFYRIEQKKEVCPYSDTFKFYHFNQSKKAYKTFGGEPPLILKRLKSYLDRKKVLDIEFFRTTPYGEVTKTFEEEDSWEQDVIILMMDVDEIVNDSIILREVDFTRPVKE